jgi:hypothetical protein
MNITNIKVREVTPINALNLATTDKDYAPSFFRYKGVWSRPTCFLVSQMFDSYI